MEGSSMVNPLRMDFFQHRYYRINKNLLTLIGQWPYQTTRSSQRLTALILFLTTTQLTPQLLAVFKYRNNMTILGECASPLIFVTFVLVKFICFICNSQNIFELIDRIRTDWQTWAGEPEENILHEHAELGRKMTIVYGVTAYSTGILFVFQPILPTFIDALFKNSSEPKKYPIPLDLYVLDMQKYYFYFMTYGIITVSGALLLAVACTSMLFVNVQHVCGIFAALGRKLEGIGNNARLDASDKIAATLYKHDVDFETLVFCINRHNDAIEYAKLIEETYTWGFLIAVGLNILCISILGIQIIERTNDPQETLRFIGWMMGNMVYIYIESYMAQILMDHSINIRNHINQSKWYNVSPSAQKLLQFMIMRCNYPCQLTAGKVKTMSMETFTAIIKTSTSYYTLLRSMKE